MAHLLEYMDAKGQKADEKITRYANENRKYKIQDCTKRCLDSIGEDAVHE